MSTYITLDDKIQECLNIIDSHFAYYLPFVLYSRIMPSKDKSMTTMCITPQLKIFYNEQFVDLLSIEELNFVLLHEFSHIIYNHHNRFKPYLNKYPHVTLNTVADLEINSFLKEKVAPNECCIKIPNNTGVFPEQLNLPKLKTFDEYLELLEQSGQMQKIPMLGQGDPLGNDCQHESSDGEDTGQGNDDLTVEQLSKLLEDCENAEKQRGTQSLLGGTQVIKPKVLPYDWSKILENLITDVYKTVAGYDYYTYSKISRRNASSNDIILPTYYSLEVDLKVVIIFDVSGSMYEIKDKVFGLLISLKDSLGEGLHIRILETDTEVLRDREDVTIQDNTPIDIVDGGGTDMTAGWNYIKKNNIDADLIICLTDGYTPYPDPPIYKEKSVIMWTDVAPDDNCTYKNYHVKI